MPLNASLAGEVWTRYQYIRDNGHLDYVLKARRCEDFFAGLQWDARDLEKLRSVRRPALTINKILSTLSNVMGEQIFNRTQIAFRPKRSNATEEQASTLSKVFMQVSDNNQLDWVRSDVFADGVISSRGFYDVRLGFADSLVGEVQITQLNPKNVLIDPDGEEYDPDKWGDVITTKWMSPDMIESLYNKEDAKALRGTQNSFWPYGYDSIDRDRDRFGTPRAVTYGMGQVGFQTMVRNIRVLERQYRVLDTVEHFADIRLGDLRPVPSHWDPNRIAEYLAQNPDVIVIKKRVPRIRWTVVADAFVLHDDWSPYNHFTVVPYFPFFRRGRTVGLVENLLGPQEYLNKITSQELHVVNTTANSGWKIKSGALKNMALGELEQRGAETGLVLELDEVANAEKITPNQVPSGLDRLSYKAEEYIKTISGVSDYRTGNAREDVAAKAVKANQAASSANTAKVMDNLQRSDALLARTVLDLIQTYYTEERVVNIVADRVTGRMEQITVNQVQPDGTVTNDLTLGEYSVTITNQPERDTFEDSQFDQALALRTEAGVPIPDKFIIQASRLQDKAQIVEALEAQAQDPHAQELAQLELDERRANINKTNAETQNRLADADQRAVRAQKELSEGQPGVDPELIKIQQQGELELLRLEREFELKREMAEREFQLKRDLAMQELELKREAAAADNQAKLLAAAGQAKVADATASAINSHPEQAAAKGAPGSQGEPDRDDQGATTDVPE